ncbi:MAG: transporter substrate-binding domain-containing protein [Burkholderiales bacterium]|jgi:hypothetical protein|nr:transporter substrate-binding domain-containing protein [Burkholderiales bacterium]
MRRRPLLVMLAAACATKAPARPAPLVYPQHDPGRVPQWHYMQAVIKLAITRSGADYELMESPVPMTQARVVRELADRSGRIDLAWTMTSIEREARLLPVRVPMDRGLIGCRIAFVRPEDVDRWRDLRDLNELSRYVAGQGQDWPDTGILRANGLPVQGISRYEALFDMLRLRRIDYFPRAVFEIDDEAATQAAHGLVIEPHVLLRYPAASYLFVRPDRPRLAAELQRGMEAAANDGSLAHLFQQYFGDLLRRHHLARRRQLLLKNPLLPLETPLHKPAYWLVIES